jgi:hypothetical protein
MSCSFHPSSPVETKLPASGSRRWCKRPAGPIRHALVLVVATAAVATTFLIKAVPQDLRYHDFADQRRLLGVPNFLNVSSNAFLVAVGVLGLARLRGGIRRIRLADPVERRAYLVFFLGVLLVGAGSAYYHLAPDNERLAWDRLPMTLVFMAFLSTLLAERVSVRIGASLLPWLAALGIASVLYWRWSERIGAGDLRFYGLVHFFPFVLLPVLFLLYPPRYTGSGVLLAGLACFAAATLLEQSDGWMFELTRVISGHTLKHLLAAAGGGLFLVMLERRNAHAGSGANAVSDERSHPSRDRKEWA